MRHVPLAIEKLLEAIADLQATGSYEQSYRRSKELLAGLEGSAIGAQALCGALIVSARSAYYMSRFDECAELLDRCRAEIEKLPTHVSREYTNQAALVGADMLRRLGR